MKLCRFTTFLLLGGFTGSIESLAPMFSQREEARTQKNHTRVQHKAAVYKSLRLDVATQSVLLANPSLNHRFKHVRPRRKIGQRHFFELKTIFSMGAKKDVTDFHLWRFAEESQGLSRYAPQKPIQTMIWQSSGFRIRSIPTPIPNAAFFFLSFWWHYIAFCINKLVNKCPPFCKHLYEWPQKSRQYIAVVFHYPHKLWNTTVCVARSMCVHVYMSKAHPLLVSICHCSLGAQCILKH